MIVIHSDHPPNIRLFVNEELFMDQTIGWNHSVITPATNTVTNKVCIENTGNRDFTANGTVIKPNKLVEIANK